MDTKKQSQLKQFGQHLRELRKKASLSLNDMSYLSKYDKAKLSRIENGKINITLSTLSELAEALGKPLCVMMDIYNDCAVSNPHPEAG